jgi:MYXO-CTERM domain-containing protein
MRIRGFAISLAIPLALAACGADERAPEAYPEVRPANARGIYIPVAPQRTTFSEPEATFALAEPLPIYMHRHGGTYTGGNDDSSQNRSSVVGSGSASVDAFDGGDAVWAEVMACTQDQFARFNAYVTDVEPTSGDYVEAVVGGYPQQIGLPNGVGGVAPIDTFSCNIISDAIVYIFSGALPNNAQLLCEIAAQEIAHALSLDHELLCEDPLTYLDGCGDKSFQDINAQCGEYSARQCDCGRPSQNSVQILYDKLGPSDGALPPPAPDDQGPPIVDVVAPNNGASLPPNSSIQVVAEATDDLGLASMELIWEYSGDSFACPLQGNGYSCEQQGSQYVWTLNVGTGDRTFQVRGRDLAGNIVTTPARTVTLDGTGEPGDPADPPVQPPQDAEAPEVSIASPVDGATMSANSIIEVTAVATDDVEVTQVGLEWDYSNDTFGCPYDSQAVTCERTGSTYRWQINVGTGTRDYRVRAQDAAGRESVTATRTINLSEGAVIPPQDDAYEDNDTWDQATSVACASGLDLRIQPGDDDWLMASVAPGVQVTASVSSTSGDPLTLALVSGPRSTDVLDTATTADGTGEVAAIADTSRVALRVRGSAEGEYRVVVSCAEPDPNNPPDPTGPTDPTDPSNPGEPGIQVPPGADVLGTSVTLRERVASGCSAAGTTGEPLALLSLLGVVALLRRRRR